jgi:S-adenosylmethionine synthetase
MKPRRVLVSDSVTEGHPDKLCDQISDAVVDHCLSRDPLARIDVECTVSNGIVFIGAHYDTEAELDFVGTARSVIEESGYGSGEFNARDCTVLTSLSAVHLPGRPARIEEDLDDAEIERLPAQQQVTVFGYACKQTDTLMPLSISLAHALARKLDDERHAERLPGILSDGKSQVALEYLDGKPERVHSVCLLVTGIPGAMSEAELRDRLRKRVVQPVFAESPVPLDKETRLLINPDGPLHSGGPLLHSGLTGRKTAVDTYGEYARHSGAALSGKDPLRIDRLGAYAARHAARNVVAAGLAEQCEVQLSYSVGLSDPISIYVDTFGTGQLSDEVLLERLRTRLDLRPAGIMRRFRLRESIARSGGRFFRRLAVYGQMGRDDLSPPWERDDAARVLRAD